MAPTIGAKGVLLKKRPEIAADTNRAISAYFDSKKEQQTAIKHYPEWDVIKGEPIIELMRVRREILVADADLSARRIEYQAGRDLAARHWQRLRYKENLLRRSLITFNDFVKENRQKRERAERKIRDEKERQMIREEEIAKLERDLQYMEEVRDKMMSHVKEYKPFQKYLELVLGTNEFQSIAEIFNRYETLVAARSALVINQDENLQMLENTSALLQKMTEEKSQSLMDLNSRLAQLQSRHARAHATALHWEAVVSRVKEVASSKESDETQVRACIWNLYRQICKRKDVPEEAKRNDLEQQLNNVKRTILELGKIVHAAKRKAAREEKEKLLKEKQQSEAHAASGASGASDTKSLYRASFDDTHSNTTRPLS